MKCRAQEPSAQSLLEFMDVASDAVKCALKKPTTFKRNINHRRYLQRQVKTVVRSRRTPRKLNPCDLKEDVQDLVREAINELRHSQCYVNALGTFEHRDVAPQCISLPQNNFHNPGRLNTTYRLTHLPAPTQQLHTSHLAQNTAGHSYDSRLYTPANFASASSTLRLNSEDECFMSGEELTHNIDINDLYIPELHEPRSPVVKCEDYIVENDLEIPSPMYDEQGNQHFQFDPNLRNLDQFL